MSQAAVKNERLGQLDTTPIHDIYKTYVDSLDRRDLKGLADIHHPNAVVLANKELSQAARTGSTAKGGDVQKFHQAHLDAGLSHQGVWEYVQGNNAFIVRFRVAVYGTESDGFGYFAIRDGKVWRHVAGIEAEKTRGPAAQVDPAKLNPLFVNLSKGLQTRDAKALMQHYAPDSVGLFAANKSWGFRARGAAHGRDEIQAFLESYIQGGSQVAELRDYVDSGDTIYVHGLMSRNGLVSNSYGAYVIENNQIAFGFSST